MDLAEHEDYVAQVRDIARRELKPIAEAGVHGRVNRELLARLADTGLLGRIFPVRAGGSSTNGIAAVELCRLREGLAQESVLTETALAVQGLGTHPLLHADPDSGAAAFLPDLVRGRKVAAFALTEPDAGSDAAAIALKAEAVSGGWRLTGEKIWISNAPDADVYVVFARTSPDGSKGVSAFVVPGDADGLSGQALEMISPHPIGRLRFDSVFVPEDHLLGEPGQGFRVAMKVLDQFRPSVGALAVGIGQAALDLAVEHARTRTAFGQPIGQFQAVSHQLVDVAVRIDASRLLVRAAAEAYDEGRTNEITRRAAAAKLYSTESAQFAVDVAIQVLGARALEASHPLSHLYRDIRAARIYEGTSEIQRNILARKLVGKP